MRKASEVSRFEMAGSKRASGSDLALFSAVEEGGENWESWEFSSSPRVSNVTELVLRIGPAASPAAAAAGRFFFFLRVLLVRVGGA